MLAERFDVLGFHEKEILFRLDGKIIIIHKRLPKEDLILLLGVQPEDVKDLRDEILVEASKRPLTYREYVENQVNENRQV